MICEFLISGDIAANCRDIIRPGVEPVGYIINKSDINSFVEEGHIVSSIALKTGKKAFKVQQLGSQPFNGTSTEMQSDDYVNSFNHVASFIVLDNSPEVSQSIIDPLSNGEFVLILENRYKSEGSKNAFEVIGIHNGAKATAVSQNKYENRSGWTVELTESEVSQSKTFFFVTALQETRDALEALLEPAE